LQVLSYIKKLAKKIQAVLPIAITKNEQYDRYTKEIIARHCKPDSVCIDIGSNEGKILDWIIKNSPNTIHFAFEPVPFLYEKLQLKYSNKVKVFPIALTDHASLDAFNVVLSNPALSGLRKRPYASYYKDKQIEVVADQLDHLIHDDQKISFIKMDVEGGELNVLKGAIKIITKSKPLILFECGKIGGDLYGFTALEMYQFFEEQSHYQIFTLKDWLKYKKPLTYSQFLFFYESGTEFFFLAEPIYISENI